MSVLLLQVSFAKADEVERTLAQEKFEVSKNALLSVEHKFGDLKCKNWDQDAISVKVTASVHASSTEKANQLLDKISIDINGNRNGVSVESNFNEKIFSGDKNGLTLDIEIMMPETVRLDIDHQFGNAYIEKATGESDITIEYGSVEIKALTSDINEIEVSFGEARINYLNGGDVEASYSTLSIDEAMELNIESDYSTVIVYKIEALEIKNEGGNVNIGEVKNIELTSKFSDFEIGRLSSTMTATTEYGALRTRQVADDFTEISVENSFGAVILEFMQGATFNLEADLEFCDLDYPKNAASFSERIIESTEKFYRGKIGDGTAKSVVSIESSFGNVAINM